MITFCCIFRSYSYSPFVENIILSHTLCLHCPVGVMSVEGGFWFVFSPRGFVDGGGVLVCV